jgi:NADPH:quinone reductase-like Zn-dependent oxidoreductase
VTALVRDSAVDRVLRQLGAAEVVERVEGDFDVIIDAVGGPTFALAIEHLTPGGLVVNLATPDDEETVTFRAPRFDRSYGARIYTLNLPDELARHGGAGRDLARLCALAEAGRLDGQVELEVSWRDATSALDALLERRIGGKAVLHVSSAQEATAP